MNFDDMDVPAILHAIRGTLDLSQEQLAGKLGVSFATVNRWERGHCDPQGAAYATIAALAADTLVDAVSARQAAALVTARRSRKGIGIMQAKTVGHCVNCGISVIERRSVVLHDDGEEVYRECRLDPCYATLPKKRRREKKGGRQNVKSKD